MDTMGTRVTNQHDDDDILNENHGTVITIQAISKQYICQIIMTGGIMFIVSWLLKPVLVVRLCSLAAATPVSKSGAATWQISIFIKAKGGQQSDCVERDL